MLPPQAWELEACASSGLTLSMLRFSISFVLSVLVGALFRFVPTVRGRHAYSLLTGVALVAYPFGGGVLHAFAPAALVYAAMLRFRSRCGTLAWLIAFPYLILQ